MLRGDKGDIVVMSDLDELCEQLWKSNLIKEIAKVIKYGQLTLTFHEERLTEVIPSPRKRLQEKD